MRRTRCGMWISASRSSTAFLQRLETPRRTSRQANSTEAKGESPATGRKQRHSASPAIHGDGDGSTGKARAPKDTGDCDDLDIEKSRKDGITDRPIYNTAVDKQNEKRKKETRDRPETPTSTPSRAYKSALKKEPSPLDKKLFKDTSKTSLHRLLRDDSSPERDEDEEESIVACIKRKFKATRPHDPDVVRRKAEEEVTPEVIGKVARSPRVVHFSDDETTTEDEEIVEKPTKSIFWDKSTLYLLIVFVVLRLLYETSSDGFEIFPGLFEEGNSSLFDSVGDANAAGTT